MTDDSLKAFEAWANTYWKDASPGAVEMLAIKRNGEYKYSGARACCIAFCAGLEVGRASRDAEVASYARAEKAEARVAALTALLHEFIDLCGDIDETTEAHGWGDLINRATEEIK